MPARTSISAATALAYFSVHLKKRKRKKGNLIHLFLFFNRIFRGNINSFYNMVIIHMKKVPTLVVFFLLFIIILER